MQPTQEPPVEPIAKIAVPIFALAFAALMVYAATLQARIWHLI